MADPESRSAYLNARKLGRKYVSEHETSEAKGYLPVLEDRIHGVEIVGEINLGYHEIPLSKVIGTRTASRSNSFAGNFMPLLADDTEFALKWQAVYQSQLSEGIREHIKVYEYLNRYYVQEGNKRVSILKYVGAASVYANVIRILPERNESSLEISIYYEFLDYDKRMYFDNLWFSKKGNFTKLVRYTEEFLKNNPSVNESVENVIAQTHRSFREAYKALKTTDINLTSGDALVEYIGIYGYPYMLRRRTLQKNIRNCRAQFLVASGSRQRNTIEISAADTAESSRKPRLRFGKLKLAFAFDGTEQDNLFTRFHTLAIDRMEKKYSDLLEIKRLFNFSKDPETAYAQLNELISDGADALFTTSPTMAIASLRIALENTELIVLNCDIPREGINLNTYFCKMYDLTFLCGVLASAMSRSGIIGYMNTSAFDHMPTYDMNAFALGARLVNPRSQVLDFRLKLVNDWNEHITARSKFAELGADVAFCRHSPDNHLDRKAFNEVYAQLYGLNKFGYPVESYAAATFNWEPFYDKVISDLLQGKTKLYESGGDDCNPIHFGWGLSTGIMDLFPVDFAIGDNGVKLVRIFRGLIKNTKFNPFEGPVYDNENTLRFESGYTPTLLEIQAMNWYESSVTELNP